MSRDGLLLLIRNARNAGCAKASGTYESAVEGIAAPLVGFRGEAISAIAVAAHRKAQFVEGTEKSISKHAMATASRVFKDYGAQ